MTGTASANRMPSLAASRAWALTAVNADVSLQSTCAGGRWLQHAALDKSVREACPDHGNVASYFAEMHY